MDEITPSEAVEYVLPLLSGLALDPGMNLGVETLRSRVIEPNLHDICYRGTGERSIGS
jgi:hypothetical protein